jgi:hypothetical protein
MLPGNKFLFIYFFIYFILHVQYCMKKQRLQQQLGEFALFPKNSAGGGGGGGLF